MSGETLCPSDYQDRRIAYANEVGWQQADQTVPRLINMIMNNDAHQEVLLQAGIDFANELVGGWNQGWQVDASNSRLIETDDSIVARIACKEGEWQQGQRTARSADGEIMWVAPLSPMRDEHDRTPEMRDGMVQAPSGPGEDLIVWKSWSTEQMDGLGIMLPWDVQEDFDREPDEE